jgi:CheY-like chemotaxis protein
MPNVLVVDDSPVDRMMAGRFLEEEPDVVISFAGDGHEALDLIRERLPDAVVTDLQMPECDGLELVDALKRDYPRLPVILMTAQGSEEIAAEALRRGAASYVPKRALAAQLRETVARILSAVAADGQQSRLMHSLADSYSRFEIQMDPELIETLTSHLQEMLRCLPLGDESERMRVGIAIKHAMLNGLYHGNVEVPFDVDDLQSPKLAPLLEQRMSASPYAERKLIVEANISPRDACFQIRHEGPGYPAEVTSEAAADPCSSRHFTRGLVLLRSLMDEVRFGEEGRLVYLLKKPQAEADFMIDE